MTRRDNQMTVFTRAFALAAWLGLMSLASVVDARLPTQVDGEPVPSLAPLIDRVSPAVVNIYSRTRVQVQMSPFADDPFFRRFFDFPSVPRERIQQSLGSGVIVDLERGTILTNNHVINNAEDIAITLQDGRELNGELIGADPDTDLAVIEVDPDALAQSERVAALDLAVTHPLRVGDFVVAIGNPFGLGQTVTSGIVSALGRSGLRGLEYQNFIQTDASINPGNSGGALINLRGELVGINTAIFTPSGGNVGIGFAVPVTTAQSVVEQLLIYGQVRRGRLGVQVQDIDDNLANALELAGPQGVIIRRIDPDGSLAAEGVQVGDVILSINDRVIERGQDLRNIEGMLPVDEKAKIELWRNGERIWVEATIEENLDERISGRRLDARLEGMMLVSAPSQRRMRGVIIEQVRRNTLAWDAGLRPGDVIVALDRRAVRDLAAFRALFPIDDDSLRLEIRRRGTVYRVPLRLDGSR